jgi:hypothetical protein
MTSCAPATFCTLISCPLLSLSIRCLPDADYFSTRRWRQKVPRKSWEVYIRLHATIPWRQQSSRWLLWEPQVSQENFYITYQQIFMDNRPIWLKWLTILPINDKPFNRMYPFLFFLFCSMTNKCTIISQIITLLRVSTLSCHPQGDCNQHLAKLHKYFKCSCW